MEERRRITTVRQLELMIEFMQDHQDLALGRVRSKEARSLSTRLWAECAEILNSEGPARTAKEWAKVWNDQKCKVRSKLMSINANQRGTGGGPHIALRLSVLEEKIASILGRDVGPLLNTAQNQFASEEDHVMSEHVVEDVGEMIYGTTDNSPPRVSNIEEILDISQPANPSPEPSLTEQVPTSLGPDRLRQRRRPLHGNQRLAQTPRNHRASSTSFSVLEESRSLILHIEKTQAEAALKNAEALKIFADAFKSIAESVDRISHKVS